MKLLLSTLTFAFVFSFAQAQVLPAKTSLKNIHPVGVTLPVIGGEARRPEMRDGVNRERMMEYKELRSFTGDQGLNVTDTRGPREEHMRNDFTDEEREEIRAEHREERGEFREGRIEHREDIKKHIEEKRELFKENRQQLQGEKKDRVSGILRGMTEKFTNALSRLDEIEIRLSNFIEENEDIDVEDALTNAQELKSVAKDSVSNVMNSLVEELDNEEGVSRELLRELVEVARTDIKAAWDAFREVITEVKSSRTENEEEGNDEDDES